MQSLIYLFFRLTMKYSYFIALLGCHVITNDLTRAQEVSAQYRDTKLSRSTGLYYEKLNQLQHIAGIWRTTVFLETTKIQQSIQSSSKKLKSTHKQCQATLEQDCRTLTSYNRLQKKILAADTSLEELQKS